MGLDRSKAPEFSIPTDFTLSSPIKTQLNSGIPVFSFQTPGTEAFKIEVIGKSSRNRIPLHQALVPSFTLQMILEGTTDFSEEVISEFLDFHATEIHPTLSFSNEGLSLLSTRKHLSDVVPLYKSLFTQATFPEKNLEKKKSQRKLALQLEREKSSSRSNQLFRKALFGEHHPFGQELTERHVDLINPEILKNYYHRNLWSDCEIFISGNFNEKELFLVYDQLEKLPVNSFFEIQDNWSLQTTKIIHEERPDALQSSIRIGSWSIPKSHPDFHALSVINTVLGGYFGSRLVKNIREEKGHTYGISSSLVEIGTYNYWVIGADVQKKYKDEVIDEIYKEIERIGTEPISQQELEIVRNYIIGQLFSKFSSSFDLMDRFKAVHYSGLDFSFYLKKMDFLQTLDSENLLVLAKQYFSNPDKILVSVG